MALPMRRRSSDPARDLLDELLAMVRAEAEPVVRERIAHGLPPTDRPLAELARMMAAPIPRRSPWDEAVGPFHDTTGVTRLLGVSRQAVQLQRERRRILALRTADGQFVYPTWQFDDRRRVLPGLADVLGAVPPGTVDDWTLASWLLRSRLSELDGRTVVEHLRAGGEPGAAIQAALRSAARWVA